MKYKLEIIFVWPIGSQITFKCTKRIFFHMLNIFDAVPFFCYGKHRVGNIVRVTNLAKFSNYFFTLSVSIEIILICLNANFTIIVKDIFISNCGWFGVVRNFFFFFKLHICCSCNTIFQLIVCNIFGWFDFEAVLINMFEHSKYVFFYYMPIWPRDIRFRSPTTWLTEPTRFG